MSHPVNVALPPGPPLRSLTRVPVEQWASFADRIDVRSPAEFAEDHLPGAVNLPVLDDAERARVGTLYAQVSAFDARKVGAALVARNIAGIVERHAADKPREWAPLVYCWRGGQRSRALVQVLSEIGFRPVQLDGGYRAWRRHVVLMLSHLPQRFSFEVVCGLTGSGKSRLLAALAESGAQVLDLERLARHRGSLLGDLPGDPQPSQKAFESTLYADLARFDPARPVFVESESKRIGRLQVPETLLETMRASPVLRLDASQAQRVEMLEADYAHLAGDGAALEAQLAPLEKLHGKRTIARWAQWAAEGATTKLASELLELHYDPSYARAIERNFPRHRDARVLRVEGTRDRDFRNLAATLVGEHGSRQRDR
ncbi:MAG: tRNA 2-selenouridine(34) synthase MnmH [Candidatus Levyibacteriota bacterium]